MQQNPTHSGSPSSPRRGPDDGLLAQWATAARHGDRDAADRLLAAARPRLTRMALAFGAAPDDVPDLVQDVLIVAWRRLEDFDPARGSFIAWLAGGLHGRVANLRRGAGRLGLFLDRLRDAVQATPQEERPQEKVDARMTLDRLLQSLAPRQRDVVALYELGGLSGKETARVLGIGEAAVRSIARDARQALKAAADQEERRSASSTGGRLLPFVAGRPTRLERGNPS